VRFQPKDFRQRRPDKSALDGWAWNMKSVRRVLFHLPELIAAVKDGRPVYVVEGEKDVLALEQAGFASTCNPGGAGKWLAEYSKHLAGAEVVIIADKDEPGRKHAADIAGKLQGIARSVKLIELPDVEGRPVKDASDHFSAGGNAEEIKALVESVPEWRPGAVAAPAETPKTEFDYANVLTDSLPPIKTSGGTWYCYKDGTWGQLERATLRPQAQNVLPAEFRTERKAAALLDHLEGRFQVSSDCWHGFYNAIEGGGVLINAANGVVTVKPSGEVTLEPHSADHLFTLRVAAAYDPKAEAKLFERVLSEALPDGADRNLFQLCAGNFLLPDCRFETALVCYGEAGRGKSTLAEAIAEALGRPLVPRLTMSQICDPKSYHVPKLRFAAVNLGTELDAVELGDSGTFKAVVSGEPVEARPIYGAPFTMMTTAKLWFLANTLPRFKHGTEAELRRTRFLRFDFLPPKKDTTLKSRLVLERDGVFRWCLAGLVELLSVSHIPVGGQHSREVHERFRISNDPVGAFVAARCRLAPGAQTTKEALRGAFRDFCEEHDLPTGLDAWFLRALYERWPTLREVRPRDEDGTRSRVILGVQLNGWK
jgi:putative DNA primase/helicase